MSAGRTLVVGADGGLGAALLAAIPGALGSTRRSATEGRLRIDLAGDPAAWQLPDPVDCALLCAARSSLRDCEEHPAETRAVNVESTVELARRLAERGAFLVFLSTSLVFDGTRPRRLAEEPACPRTAYGRQKVEAEARLQALGAPHAIVRLTKVVAPGHPLFEGWRTDLAAGREIHPFEDMLFSPLPLSFVTKALAAIATRREGGIYQVSGERDLSYAEAAAHLAGLLGAEPGLVQPVRAADRGFPPESLPAHTTLDDRRIREAFGMHAPDGFAALEQGLGWRP